MAGREREGEGKRRKETVEREEKQSEGERDGDRAADWNSTNEEDIPGKQIEASKIEELPQTSRGVVGQQSLRKFRGTSGAVSKFN